MLAKRFLFLSMAVLLFSSGVFALDYEAGVEAKVNLLYEEQNFAMFYMERNDNLVADREYNLIVDGAEVGEVRIKKVEQYFTVAEVLSLTDWSIEGRVGVLKPSAPAGYAGQRRGVKVGTDVPKYDSSYGENAEEAWVVSDVDYPDGEWRREYPHPDHEKPERGKKPEPSYRKDDASDNKVVKPEGREERKQQLKPALAGTSLHGTLGLIFLPTTDHIGYKRARLTISRVQQEISGGGAVLFGANYEGKADNTIYAVTYGLTRGVEVSYSMDVMHNRAWISAPDAFGFASGRTYESSNENEQIFSVKAVYPRPLWNGASVGAAYVLEKGAGGDTRYYRFLLTLFDDRDVSLHGMYGGRDYESGKNFEYGYAAKVRLNGDTVLFGEHFKPDTSDEYFDDYKIKSYGVQFRLSGNLSGRFTYIESEVLEDIFDTKIVSYDIAYDF